MERIELNEQSGKAAVVASFKMDEEMSLSSINGPLLPIQEITRTYPRNPKSGPTIEVKFSGGLEVRVMFEDRTSLRVLGTITHYRGRERPDIKQY